METKQIITGTHEKSPRRKEIRKSLSIVDTCFHLTTSSKPQIVQKLRTKKKK